MLVILYCMRDFSVHHLIAFDMAGASRTGGCELCLDGRDRRQWMGSAQLCFRIQIWYELRDRVESRFSRVQGCRPGFIAEDGPLKHEGLGARAEEAE